jgi:uroporphyrin-III C-methyltransferase / precorrin-2 dehydrogenase / sirohydrochlorin ferrochelatase
MEFLPLFVKLDQRAVLVVGGGDVAARKIRLLRAANADITVVAPVLCAELAALGATGALHHIDTEFAPSQITRQRLVIAATDDPMINEAVARAANAAGVLVNVVDDLALSTCVVPAIIDRDPVVVAVSTGGSSPVLATQLRAQIETLLPPSLGALAQFARRHRTSVKAQIPALSVRRRFWSQVLDGEIGTLVLEGRNTEADSALGSALQTADTYVARVRCRVVAISSEPDALTLGTLRNLYSAEVIVYDEDVSSAILAYARRDAEQRVLSTVATRLEFIRSRREFLRPFLASGTSLLYLTTQPPAWAKQLDQELHHP